MQLCNYTPPNDSNPFENFVLNPKKVLFFVVWKGRETDQTADKKTPSLNIPLIIEHQRLSEAWSGTVKVT